jgi:hypothetical protein
MAMHPETGEIYAHEHGPRGGDELNLIKPNTNYGWPVVTFGINYDGSQITPDTTLPGMELPLTYWVPSIAPSGMTFIKNGQPNNEADILIGALAGTHIHWLKMKDNKRVASSRSMNGYARFRDIRQAPDGKIYAMTESPSRFVQLRINGLATNSVYDVNTGNEQENLVYPNPSSEESTLSFEVSSDQLVSVRIYNIHGIVVQEMPAQFVSKGRHSLAIHSFDLAKGMYYVEINKGGVKSVLKYVKM